MPAVQPVLRAAALDFAEFMKLATGYKQALDAGFLTQAEYDKALAEAKRMHLNITSSAPGDASSS